MLAMNRTWSSGDGREVRASRHGGGAWILLATNHRDRWIFIYGFLKNQRANVSHREMVALRELSRDLLALTDEQLNGRTREKILIEVGSEAIGNAEPHSLRGP